jgi:hypothetical protein
MESVETRVALGRSMSIDARVPAGAYPLSEQFGLVIAGFRVFGERSFHHAENRGQQSR